MTTSFYEGLDLALIAAIAKILKGLMIQQPIRGGKNGGLVVSMLASHLRGLQVRFSPLQSVYGVSTLFLCFGGSRYMHYRLTGVSKLSVVRGRSYECVCTGDDWTDGSMTVSICSPRSIILIHSFVHSLIYLFIMNRQCRHLTCFQHLKAHVCQNVCKSG